MHRASIGNSVRPLTCGLTRLKRSGIPPLSNLYPTPYNIVRVAWFTMVTAFHRIRAVGFEKLLFKIISPGSDTDTSYKGKLRTLHISLVEYYIDEIYEHYYARIYINKSLPS